MPAIPKATETVRDFGLGLTRPASMMPLVIGVSSVGATNAVEFYASPTSLREARGEGPAVECAANILSQGGGPVGFVGTDSAIAGSLSQVLPTYGTASTQGAITKSGAGPTITVSGAAATGHYLMRIEITTGGVLGTSQFRWSIDGGSTWLASAIATPVSGTHELSTATFATGITATFPAGTYVLNETYSWTSTPGGGQIAVSGNATLDAHVRVEIVRSGALGVATFRYSVDGYSGDTASERSYSEVLTVPSGGTFAVTGLGVTLAFDDTPTAFVAGDSYVFDAECDAFNATDLSAAFTAIAAASATWRFCVAVTSKANGDAIAHALLAAALQSHLTTLANSAKYRRGMIAATHDDTAAATVDAFDDVVATRLLVSYGQVRRVTVKPFPGFSYPVTSAVDVIAARAARSEPSTDLKRVRSGSLEEVVKIFHDEYRSPSQLDDVKISTLRTFENFLGFYVCQARLKSPAGSDFKLWPMGLVMDIACETVNAGLTESIGRGVRIETRVEGNTTYVGTIDERDATVIENDISARLIAKLMSPLNEEGYAGHISDIRYRIVRTHNFLATGAIIGEVGIKPLGYVDYATTTVGFVVDLPEG